MGRRIVVLCAAAAGCLSSPTSGGDADGGDPVGHRGDGGGESRCKALADAQSAGEVAGSFVALEGILSADLDGDGDRDLVLHGETPLGAGMVVVRLPQSGPLAYQVSLPLAGPSAVAAADLVGGDGCAELVAARTGGTTTPFAILGQGVSGDPVFRSLGDRELGVDASDGLWLAADPRLADGDPAVALATPSRLYALPTDGLLTGEPIRTVTAPDFAGIRGIAPVRRGVRTELLIAEDGRLRWMAPVLPGGQLQFNPLRVITVALDPVTSAAGADLDRDGEADDLACAGDSAIGLVLDDSVDPPTMTPAPSPLAADCSSYAALAIGQLDAAAADLVVLDTCAEAATVSVLIDARVAAGPSLAGTRVDAVVGDLDAVAMAVADVDGDGREDVLLFDAAGASRCLQLSGGELVACGE